MVSPVIIYTAKKKIRLHGSNYCMSSISTLWNGEVIMCSFDNTQNKICNLYCTQEFDHESFEQLELVIKEFLHECFSKDLKITI